MCRALEGEEAGKACSSSMVKTGAGVGRTGAGAGRTGAGAGLSQYYPCSPPPPAAAVQCSGGGEAQTWFWWKHSDSRGGQAHSGEIQSCTEQ